MRPESVDLYGETVLCMCGDARGLFGVDLRTNCTEIVVFGMRCHMSGFSTNLASINCFPEGMAGLLRICPM